MLVNKRSTLHHGTQWPAQPNLLEEVVLSAPRACPIVSAQSVIEPSVTIVGDLWSEGDAQVDGRICGNVNCARLVVGKSGAITGTILAEEAVVYGRTIGTIRATRVLLQSTARVESEVIYKRLLVDEGARFEGVASYRSNPLQDGASVSPMSELREIIAETGADGSLAASKARDEAASFSSRVRKTG
jgi:cytoskeletal protein CcmA (bactofilin family)